MLFRSQAFYVNIAGEDRVIIVNGDTPDSLAEALKTQIEGILSEKELDGYYQVEALATSTNVTGDTYVPNNGHKVSLQVSEAGAPYLRPDLSDISLTGTVAIVSGAVTGTGTTFQSELGAGDVIVANGTRYTVTAVSNNTTATVTPTNVKDRKSTRLNSSH